MAKRRIRKTSQQLLRDCEVHLRFLSEALSYYSQQPDRYRQIAAELRVLVCETRSNKPILLDMMDQFDFPFAVQPPGEPFNKAPTVMVGWKDDPSWHVLQARLSNATTKDDIDFLLDEQAKLRRPVPIREYVNSALAVHIAPYDYSYRDLTLAIAQQVGSSHEDEAVDQPLLQLQSILVGGHPGHIAPILGFAKRILSCGEHFFRHLQEAGQYERKGL